MTRRSFFRSIASTVAAVAVVQGIVRSWVKEPELRFRPQDYVGEWKFVVECKDGGNYIQVETPDFVKLGPHVTSFISEHHSGTVEYKRYENRDGRFVRVS